MKTNRFGIVAIAGTVLVAALVWQFCRSSPITDADLANVAKTDAQLASESPTATSAGGAAAN